MIDVGDQRKREIELRGEALAVLTAIEAGADDLGVFRLVLLVEVPEPGTFCGSAGCIGFRKKPENDFLAAQIAQPDGPVVMIDGIEVGSNIARLEHPRTSCDRLQRKTKRTGE